VSRRLPEDVERFLARYIGTVDQLEILLLLRAEASRLWSAGEIGARMRRPEESTAARLDVMLEQGLVERDGERFRYRPGGHDADVDSVGRSFATRRAAVIEAIFADSRT
jgi:DNA-binding IclR family transcriptional regulator